MQPMKLKRNTLVSSFACAGVWSLPASGAIINEIEPNDDFSNATALTADDQGVGTLDGFSDVDWWKFTGLTSGAPFELTVEGPELCCDDEILVELFDVSDLLSSLASTVLDPSNPSDVIGDVIPGDGMLGVKFSFTEEDNFNFEGYQFSLRQVPEPATAALLGVGLAALGNLRRKQRRPETS